MAEVLYSWTWYFTPPARLDSPSVRSRFASRAPMIEARTISSSPDLSATNAMISSGTLPNVALSSPPAAGPNRLASCSVA